MSKKTIQAWNYHHYMMQNSTDERYFLTFIDNSHHGPNERFYRFRIFDKPLGLRHGKGVIYDTTVYVNAPYYEGVYKAVEEFLKLIEEVDHLDVEFFKQADQKARATSELLSKCG